MDFNTQQDIETRKSKRGHVLGELLETERIYVAEMGSILRVSRNQYIINLNYLFKPKITMQKIPIKIHALVSIFHQSIQFN